MSDDAAFAVPPVPAADTLPGHVLYATSARLGGSGLDVTSLEGALAAHEAGILGKVIAYANQQHGIPAERVRSLAWHAVRLLSGLGSAAYYGAKKKYLDRIASRELERGRYDLLHTWSGDALHSLITARQRGIPSIMDIPTWHRNKGRTKPFVTMTDRSTAAGRGWAGWKARLPVSRQQVLMEYELATLLLMPSQCSTDTFRAAGIEEHRLHYVGRGVDIRRFTPGSPPGCFRLVFTGALIRRKGVHLLLRAWKALALPDAELVLLGTPHDEIKSDLRECTGTSVKVNGFVSDVASHLRSATAFVFPSECEGFAKATLEAAACGLPLVATRESGDAIVDRVTGYLIPPDNVDALADAIRDAYDAPAALAEMGRAARARVERYFTWDHYRARLLAACARSRAAMATR